MLSSGVTLIVNNSDDVNHGHDNRGESHQGLGVTAARKLAAAQKRASRKAARRDRLFSESTCEYPTKGILKHRPPPKRSVSECIDDVSQIMDDLSIDLSEHNSINSIDESSSNPSSDSDRPKKSVRFNEEVYETLFIASCLYDRRNFAKYHFSTRHHPPPNQTKKNGSNKRKSGGGDTDGRKKSGKSKNKKKTPSDGSSDGYTDTSSDDQSSGQEDNGESNQYNDDSYIDLQSSLGSKMSKHNRKENREKKSTNLGLVQHFNNNNRNNDENGDDKIFRNNVDDNNDYDIRSSDVSTKNGSTKHKDGGEENGGEKKPPRRSTIDSGYDSTEEDNSSPWTTVRKGRKRWNSSSN